MKPVRLEMEGFGSYLEHTVLDFDRIRSGLYLITGPTGSGKTTIFDAISYALYGLPSGSGRTEASLRSKNATLDTPTYVDLVFTYAGKRYHVRRNPEYVRKAKVGQGTGVEKKQILLELPDGSQITNLTRADHYIFEEIMHLNKDQFSKIAMLAQGEFQKLLTANTAEKGMIFRQIFRTGLYDSIEERIGIRRKAIEKKREVLSISIDNELRRVPDPGLGEEVAASLDDVREKRMSVADSIHVLLEIERTLDELSEKGEEEFHDLEAREAELNGEKSLLEDYRTTEGKIRELEDMLPDVEARSKVADEEYEKAFRRFDSEREDITLQLGFLKNMMRRFDDLEREESYYADTLAQCDRKRKHISDFKEKVLSVSGRIEALQKTMESIRDRTDDLITLHGRMTGIDGELSKLRDAEGALRNAEDAEKRYSEEKYLFEEALSSFQDARTSYDEAYEVFYSQQAGIMAQKLVEGTPCPVCGSVHHPCKAGLKDATITESVLKARQKERDLYDRKMKEASLSAGSAEERMNLLKKDLSDLLETLGISPEDDVSMTLQERKDTLCLEKDNVADAIASIEEEGRRKAEAEGRLRTATDEHQRMKFELDDLENDLAESEGILKSVRKNLKEQRERLSEYSKERVLEEDRRLRDEVIQMRDDYERTKNAKYEIDEVCLKVRGGLDNFRMHLSELRISNADEDEINMMLSDISEKKKELNDLSLKIHSDRVTIGSIVRNLEKNQKSYDEIDRQYSSINMLYLTFSGQLGGARKIGLETYVQMAYFDRILARANTRLLSMTAGRYEMRREKFEDIDNRRSQKGLDVLIVDHYEGCDRAVQTLSGGEKFLSSLCLALGLSEEIESEAGGVHLDSMFIDEGFGSLDSESISLAMKALSDLSSGQKMVGIISHVDALKDRIDKKIAVTRNMQGESQATIIA